VVISVVTTDMVNEELLRCGEVTVAGISVKARQVANQIALQKAVEKTGVSKIITFHRTVDSAKSFTGPSRESISSHLLAFATDHVRGTMSSSERNRRMTAFRNAPKAIMSNARCLTEGVDVPVIDMVAFIAPKRSRIDIVQATGRAMRKPQNGSKEFGYILLPLFVEQMRSETLQEALERTAYEEIWQVLQAMQEQDEDLAETIRQMREERGRTKGFDDSRFREKVSFIGPEISLDILRESITARCIENLGDKWDERFGELKEYRERFGDCNVPKDWKENKSLGVWVDTQRQRGRGKGLKLTERQIRSLDELGFIWDPFEAKWETMFMELVKFKDEYGHCNVPHNWKENRSLGSWVAQQRRNKEKNKLDIRKVERLTTLEIIWTPYDAYWEKMFDELVDYYKICKKRNFSSKWIKNNLKLGTWVHSQRIRKNKGLLEKYKIDKLDKFGFPWNISKPSWNDMFLKLLEYKNINGNCNVSSNDMDNVILFNWVTNQRKRYNDGKLKKERAKLLNDAGFIWNTLDSTWEEMFKELVIYKRDNGNCLVSRSNPKYKKLGLWCNSQRVNKKLGILSEDREIRLNKIGFVWHIRNERWEKMFDLLREYKDKNGNCEVPKVDGENKLRTWLDIQRVNKKRGVLHEERFKRLTELGVRWFK